MNTWCSSTSFPDRFFLNGYIAKLQEPNQLSWFLCQHRGEEIPRYEVLGEMTRSFVAAIEKCAAERKIPIVQFDRGQRKETIAQPYFGIRVWLNSHVARHEAPRIGWR